MVSTSETGHAKNVANFEHLIAAIAAYGTGYNPSRDALQLPALKSLLAVSKESLNAVHVAQAAYSNAVAARETAFEPFGKLIVRVNNSLKATDTTAQVDESAQTIVRKLQGKRAGAKLTDEEKKSLEAAGKEANQVSVSQMSFDSRLDNFDKLIELLRSIPQYSPNEEELKVASLQTLYTALAAKNSDVTNAALQLDRARIARDELLYKPTSGLVDIAFDAKTYAKAAFGASNPYYKQLSGLEFKSVNK